MKKLLTPFLFLFICCNSQPQQNDNCYFPAKAFLTEYTYCYLNQNDTTEKMSFKMLTTISGVDTLFKTEIYDSQNRLIEIMTEKIQNGNSSIASYIICNYDSVGNKQTVECKMLDSAVYKETQQLEESIQWRVRFKDFSSNNTCELKKVRKLKSTSDTAQVFLDHLTFNMVGSEQKYQYDMASTYKKGKGLISYNLSLPEGTTKNFVLIIQ